MWVFVILLLVSDLFPLARAWRANRNRSLSHTIAWATLACLGWTVVSVSLVTGDPVRAQRWIYLALCLTGCAGVAVLGARRPTVAAWNLVVAAMLGVNLLPLLESLLKGTSLHVDGVRAVCVAATVAVGMLNYVPTLFAPASILLLLGCGISLRMVISVELVAYDSDKLAVALVLLGFVPWTAWLCVRGVPPALSAFDHRWLDFRNRYGFVWAQRLRDQFNRSAANSSWPVILRWQGLRIKTGTEMPQDEVQSEILATLQALMKRFGPPA
jgi:hypothetical protein